MKKKKTTAPPALATKHLKDLLDRHQVESKKNLEKASIGSQPIKAADLAQDAGGGYNADGTFPQE